MVKCLECDINNSLFYTTKNKFYYICYKCKGVTFIKPDTELYIPKQEVLLLLPSEVFEYYNQAVNVNNMVDYGYTCLLCGAASFKNNNIYKCLDCGFEWEVKYVE